MNEQLSGVEDFDPAVALYLIIQQATETYTELWDARFQEAAFGSYSALSGEAPEDESEYEQAALTHARDFVCEQLDLFKENGLVPMVFNPNTQSWCMITGVGINAELLSLVAVVFDPQEPESTVTKLLGPDTDMMYTEPPTTFDLAPGSQTNIVPTSPMYDTLSNPIRRLPFFLETIE